MKYQDLKIRDAVRVGVIGTAGILVALGGLIWPDATRGLVEPLPLSRNGDEYMTWLIVASTMGVLCWIVVAQYLLRSPADDARVVAKLKAQNKPLPKKFDPTLLDADDPEFGTPTWRYAIARWRSARR
ncbi:hypothetical protein [uncultured Phenylobacterium sp.]|uniref:hypothetical protein n=1 Tax=uncultured Phenylobacterium sp. TaxID=349273 RepID=UPI0025D963C5|nr:hypothetical protein [uncultured Phenylobacterium sp.]